MERISDAGNCKTHSKQPCSSLTPSCKLNWTQLFWIIEDTFGKTLPPSFQLAYWNETRTWCEPCFSLLAAYHFTSKPSESFKSASQRGKHMQIALTLPIWVKFSQDSMEGPEDCTAGLPRAGEHQGSCTEPSPIWRAAVLKMEKVPQVLMVLLASFCSCSPFLQVLTDFLPFQPSAGGFWAAWLPILMAGWRWWLGWKDDENHIGYIDLHRKKCEATLWRENGLGVALEWEKWPLLQEA